MANHPSALKAHRQSLARKRRNKSNRSHLRTALKKFSEQIKTGKTDDGRSLLTPCIRPWTRECAKAY